MNCTEFRALFDGTLETPGSLDATAREHLASCPSCHSEWDIQRQLDATIIAWQSEAGIDALNLLSPLYVPPLMETLRRSAPPVQLAGSVLKELNIPLRATSGNTESEPVGSAPMLTRWREASTTIAEIQTGRPELPQPLFIGSQIAGGSPRAGGIAVLVAAACLLFAVMITSQPSQRRSLLTPTLTVVPPHQLTEPAGEQVAVDVSETLTAVFSDLRSEYQEMATETSSAARDLVKVIPVGANPLSLYGAEHPYPEDFEIRAPAVDATRIWRPISTKVETALGFLWNTVPSPVPAG